MIDPGHGVINYRGELINGGKKTRGGIYEHILNFKIAQKLGDFLKKEGARVIYTRNKSRYYRQSISPSVDNKARAIFANQIHADIFIAIHCDWDPRTRMHGVTTIYKKKESRRLGEIIQRCLVRDLKAKDRELTHDRYTVLDYAAMPAVIVESGFLSNAKESKKLVTPEYQTKIASAIAKGIEKFFRS